MTKPVLALQEALEAREDFRRAQTSRSFSKASVGHRASGCARRSRLGILLPHPPVRGARAHRQISEILGALSSKRSQAAANSAMSVAQLLFPSSAGRHISVKRELEGMRILGSARGRRLLTHTSGRSHQARHLLLSELCKFGRRYFFGRAHPHIHHDRKQGFVESTAKKRLLGLLALNSRPATQSFFDRSEALQRKRVNGSHSTMPVIHDLCEQLAAVQHPLMASASKQSHNFVCTDASVLGNALVSRSALVRGSWFYQDISHL